ncbi:hypothetical protein T492DRAFT_1100604 [Pavlovales sp. CCMP2436]|nr:hypothetical protein T492DRAFT_1100604 [Pavlovales sp. CCMP2436]|mmetsp:Transcript_14812/g.37422  ORF Transcript_14812/g.37422 Transcript_14812/m.37422 type:complete len:297 (+) Transcript_14812:106-996(+)
MDFSFKKTARKRQIVGDEHAKAPKASPKASPASSRAAKDAQPSAQRPKIDESVAKPPQSRRKSRAAASDLPLLPLAAPSTPASAAKATGAHAPVPSSDKTSVAAPPSARATPASQKDARAEEGRAADLAAGHLGTLLEAAGKARGEDGAAALGEVVSRFLELVRAKPPTYLAAVVSAGEVANKLALVESLERESAAWEAALNGALQVAGAFEPAVTEEPPLLPTAALTDMAPEVLELCVRASFELDAVEQRLRWARAAQGEARSTHARAAERVHAKAFGAYERVDNPSALLRAVTA